MTHVEETFTWENGRGKKLHCRRFSPAASSEAKGIVLLHHGFREHTGRYDMVLEPLAAAGYHCFIYDCEGHGKSEPLEGRDRFVIHSTDTLATDMIDFCDAVVSPFTEGNKLKVFAAGNSMGGQVSILAALVRPELFSGLLLLSPAVDAEWNITLHVLSAVSSILNVVTPYAQLVAGTPLEEVTNHEGDRELIRADPLIPTGNFEVRTGKAFVDGFRKVAANEHKLDLPIVVIIGSQDNIVSASAAKRLLQSAASQDVSYVEMQGGWHMLVNGTDHKDECLEHMKSWLAAQVAR